jgi:hypothetical protein
MVGRSHVFRPQATRAKHFGDAHPGSATIFVKGLVIRSG